MMWWLGLACAPGHWQAVALGASSGCATRMNGTVRCWNGKSTIIGITSPEGEFSTVSVGDEEGAGIRNDGSVEVWSDDFDGYPDVPSGAFSDVALGEFESVACGIQEDGTIDCWGTAVGRSASPPTGTFKQISAGMDLFAAVSTMGELKCWNYVNCDEWSDLWFDHVEVTGFSVCALDVGGTIRCTRDASSVGDFPLGSEIPAGSFTDVAVGGGDACALDHDGKVTCWGYWTEGYWTDPPSTTFTDITGGGGTFCGITVDNHIECWGSDFVSSGIDFEM